MQTSLASLFKDYCRINIREKANPLSETAKEKIISNLRQSPFRSVLQAWTVLDFYDYKHLWAEGFDTFFGYKNEEISSEAILEMVHPEDREAFGQLYYLVLEGLMNMNTPVKNIGHFCISYRVKNKSGQYLKVLETNNIIESDPETNIPLLCLSQMSLIEGIHKSNEVTYYFLIRDENDSVSIMESFLQQYKSRTNIFSETEIKIVRLLKAGHTSQEVADKIDLSKHSIDKYRKRLLEKTDTQNTPQLLAYLTEINVL